MDSNKITRAVFFNTLAAKLVSSGLFLLLSESMLISHALTTALSGDTCGQEHSDTQLQYITFNTSPELGSGLYLFSTTAS